MFLSDPLSSIRNFSLYTQQSYMSCRFADSLQAGSGRNCSSILILLASCQETCMTYTFVVCTVKNSWWWTEELSETCRVLLQEFITMHGHLNLSFIGWVLHLSLQLEFRLVLRFALECTVIHVHSCEVKNKFPCGSLKYEFFSLCDRTTFTLNCISYFRPWET